MSAISARRRPPSSRLSTARRRRRPRASSTAASRNRGRPIPVHQCTRLCVEELSQSDALSHAGFRTSTLPVPASGHSAWLRTACPRRWGTMLVISLIALWQLSGAARRLQPGPRSFGSRSGRRQEPNSSCSPSRPGRPFLPMASSSYFWPSATKAKRSLWLLPPAQHRRPAARGSLLIPAPLWVLVSRRPIARILERQAKLRRLDLAYECGADDLRVGLALNAGGSVGAERRHCPSRCGGPTGSGALMQVPAKGGGTQSR